MGKRFTFLSLVLGAGLALVPPCSGAPGGFENTGNLANARYDHTATLLANAKVLVAGGLNYPSGSNPFIAELYDPASGTWTTTGTLNSFHAAHTATLLPNGKVFVAAGGNALFTQRVSELYDPASGAWTATGDLVDSREGHTATLLPNGKVLAVGGHWFWAGGFGSFRDSAELFDPTTGVWTATGSLAEYRAYHTATLLPDGKVLVAGGQYQFPGVRSSAELYDPASGTWTATGSLITARAKHTATLLPNGNVLVVGGVTDYNLLASAELYDPASGTWTATDSLPEARSYYTATSLRDGKVLVAGGASNSVTSLPSAELYDPASGTWMTTGSLITARFYHTATLLANGSVLVAAGTGGFGSDPLTSAELYITPPLLLNLSTRLRVETGDNAMIGGFIVTGNVSKKVIIRAIGPSLTAFGIPGALSDSTLELHDASGATVHNDDWQTTVISDFVTDQSGEIRDSGLAPRDPHESAMIVYLIPGPYTAVVRGKNDGTAWRWWKPMIWIRRPLRSLRTSARVDLLVRETT